MPLFAAKAQYLTVVSVLGALTSFGAASEPLPWD